MSDVTPAPAPAPQSVIVEAPDTGTTPIKPSDSKEAAFMMPEKTDVEGFTCHAFAKLRKGFVVATGNELCNTSKHIEEFKESHPDWMTTSATPQMIAARDEALAAALLIEDPLQQAEATTKAHNDFDGQVEWCVMVEAVPDFAFHMTALAYLCVGTVTEISRLVGKSREYFNEKVFAWAEDIDDATLDKLQMRAFQELIESNIGSDWKVKEEKNATPGAPNSPS